MGKKIEFWDVRYIVKWYDIINKLVFLDGKIRCDIILRCECFKSCLYVKGDTVFRIL